MTKPSHTILLVEDDPDLLELTALKLTNEGFEVVKADTGGKALERLKTSVPSLTLLDILLPDIDGLTVLAEISKNPRLKDMPVIILSNLADQGALDQAAAVGKYEYLVKAKTDLNMIISRIKAHLGME